MSRDRGDTNGVRTDGRHVNLVRIAPVELHMVGPRFDAIMPPEAEAAPIAKEHIETSPLPDQRAFRRSSAYDDDVCIYHPDNTSSEQNPVTIAASPWSLSRCRRTISGTPGENMILKP